MSAVVKFEAPNSIFSIIHESNSFLITKAGRWIPEGVEEFISKLNQLLELRSQSDFALHVKEVNKRGAQVKLENSGHNLVGFDHL